MRRVVHKEAAHVKAAEVYQCSCSYCPVQLPQAAHAQQGQAAPVQVGLLLRQGGAAASLRARALGAALPPLIVTLLGGAGALLPSGAGSAAAGCARACSAIGLRARALHRLQGQGGALAPPVLLC